MKLKEYFAAVAHVLHEHRTEGEIFDAVTEGKTEEGKQGVVLKEFDRAIAEVRDSLLNNKKLLGLFDDDSKNPEPKEQKLEKEIDEKAMRRHVLKVRRDLSRFAPKSAESDDKTNRIAKFEWIVTRIVSDLNKALGDFPELGGIFSKTEEQQYRREFGNGTPLTLEELTRRAIAARTKSYEEQKAAIDALNAQLRKEGKIL